MHKFPLMLAVFAAPLFTTAQFLDWDSNTANPGADGGAGTWNLTNGLWWNGTTNVQWPMAPGSHDLIARFGSAAGTVVVSGQLATGGIEFANPAYNLSLSYNQSPKLEIHGGIDGAATILFPSAGQVARYTDAVLLRGVHFYGGAAVEVDANFTGQGLQGAPVIGVWGVGTAVTLNGKLSVAGDGGQTFVSIAPRDGGKLIFGDDAEVDIILSNSLFTRQLWIHGDGTGTVEFAEGFVADLTEGGTIARGMGSYRISNTTLVTHHTQGLPTSERPDGVGGTQINGHLVFERDPGSIWRVLTNPQTYNAGVWIQKDITIDTQQNLTHTGITTFSSHSGSYWAANAFQTDADNVTLTKTGPAALILEEEAAFRPGSIMRIEEGEVIFQKDPADGVQKNIAPQKAGPNLNAQVKEEGILTFNAPLSRLASIDNDKGDVVIAGEVSLTGDFSQNHQTGKLIFHLGANSNVALHVTGVATLGGSIQIEREMDFFPPSGTQFDILHYGDRSGQFVSLIDNSGLGLGVEYLSDRIRLTTSSGGMQSYGDWAAAVFGSDYTDPALESTVWGRNANPSGDGIRNELKYHMGQAPLQRLENGLLKLEIENEDSFSFLFTVRTDAPADSWQVESSAALTGSWNGLPAENIELIESRADNNLYRLLLPRTVNPVFIRLAFNP